MSSTAFALRVDGPWLPELVELADFYQLGGFAVREQTMTQGESTNLHHHVLWTCPSTQTLKLPALRKMLLQKIPSLRGNGSYSFTTVRDLEKYCRYLAKGSSAGEHPVVVWQHGLFDIEALHDAYWAEHKERYKPQLPVVEHIIEACKEQNVSFENRSKIAEMYVTEQVKRKKGVNIFQIRSQVNLIQCVLDGSGKKIADFAAEI